MTVALEPLETKGRFHRLRSAELVSLPRLLGARLENLNLLLLGSCQVEHLTLSALRSGHKTSHFLYYSSPHCELPSGDFREYDAAIVGLTLRALLYEAAGHAPDVAHARETWTADFAQEVLERLENNLNDRVGRIRERVPGIPLFFLSFVEPSFNYSGSLIHDPTPRNLTVFMRRANDALQRVLSVHNGCYYLDLNGAMNMVGRAHLFEDGINAFSHNSTISRWGDDLDQNRIIPPIPIEDVFDVHPNINMLHDLVLEQVADSLKTLRRTDEVKLIILDLDDTLWRGIAAEETNEDEEKTTGWPLGLVEALLYFKQRGGMLAICSKNDEETTRARFSRIWSDRIVLDDFVSAKINWSPKSENIAAILQEVNLLPDSAVFIDDNPREIDEVQARFPSLRCLGGNHRDWRRIILQAPEMQVAEITQESSHRTQMVKASINRKAVAQTMNRDEWLQSLELRQEVMVVANEQDPLFSRALELLNKTNQFNTTGERWSQEALIAFIRNGGVVLATSLRDKAVNNGVVGVCLINRHEIVQAALSCRVFGLGAEIVLGSIATTLALKAGSVVTGKTIDTGRNAVSRDFFTRLGYTGGDGSYQAIAACSLPTWIELSSAPFHRSCETVEDSFS